MHQSLTGGCDRGGHTETYWTGLPLWARNRSKSAKASVSVAVLILGWNEISDALRRSRSRHTRTCRSLSWIKPKGDTDPGVTPRYAIIRSGDAKLSLPSPIWLATPRRSTRFVYSTINK